MVAMFSLFCGATEPIFSSCLPPHNGGYDYLLFDAKEDGGDDVSPPPTAPTTATTTTTPGVVVDAGPSPKFVPGNPSVIASSAKPAPYEAAHTGQCHSKEAVTNWHRKWSTASQSSKPLHAKAASEPPPDCCNKTAKSFAKKSFSSFRVHNSVAKRPKYHFSSSIAEKERKVRQKLTTNDTIGRISRFMHFLESLNPLNGFKDKDDLENYLYNQSHKIEPKNGEILSSKPKHSPEALKSPGIKQQKTPISGGGGGTFHRFPTAKSSGKSSASSPHSPCHAPGSGGGALLSPSHINVPTRSPVSAGSASGSSMALAEDPNFAIVDISPGQFPRWLGDTCGRINAAFISEYAPTTAAATFHPHRQMSSGGSPTSPSAAIIQQQQRRRPPAPLSAGESHFTFPPAQQHQQLSQHPSQQQHIHHHQLQHQQQQQQRPPHHMEPCRKPPAPAPHHHHHQMSAVLSCPLDEVQQQRVTQPPPPPPFSLPQLVPSLSTALPAFPLAKPPLARKKMPAADPTECLSPSTTIRTGEQSQHPMESCFTPTETPPQLPPRIHPPLARQQLPYQQSPLSNFMMGAGGCCNALPEAMAPPRPPKKGICRSPTTDQPTTPQLRQRQSSHQSLSPNVVESPLQLIADAIAPPIPPKPAKSTIPKQTEN